MGRKELIPEEKWDGLRKAMEEAAGTRRASKPPGFPPDPEGAARPERGKERGEAEGGGKGRKKEKEEKKEKKKKKGKKGRKEKKGKKKKKGKGKKNKG